MFMTLEVTKVQSTPSDKRHFTETGNSTKHDRYSLAFRSANAALAVLSSRNMKRERGNECRRDD